MTDGGRRRGQWPIRQLCANTVAVHDNTIVVLIAKAKYFEVRFDCDAGENNGNG